MFARQPLHRVADLEALGPELDGGGATARRARARSPGSMLDGVPQKAIFASAQVARLDKPVTMLSILPVQSELGALEVAAQADLVRVLTHEIMNSLTPVTSLARSGAEMVAAAEKERRQISPRRGSRPRPSPGAPRASCASSKAIASSRRRRKSIAARSRPGPGRKRSCAWRSPNAEGREIDARLEVEPKTLNLDGRSGAARPGGAQPAAQCDARDGRDRRRRSSRLAPPRAQRPVPDRGARQRAGHPGGPPRETSSCPSTRPTRAAAASA